MIIPQLQTSLDAPCLTRRNKLERGQNEGPQTGPAGTGQDALTQGEDAVGYTPALSLPPGWEPGCHTSLPQIQARQHQCPKMLHKSHFPGKFI